MVFLHQGHMTLMNTVKKLKRKNRIGYFQSKQAQHNNMPIICWISLMFKLNYKILSLCDRTQLLKWSQHLLSHLHFDECDFWIVTLVMDSPRTTRSFTLSQNRVCVVEFIFFFKLIRHPIVKLSIDKNIVSQEFIHWLKVAVYMLLHLSHCVNGEWVFFAVVVLVCTL